MTNPRQDEVADAPAPVRKAVLAFSGGLDTTFCVHWLREEHDCSVVTVTVDTGGFEPAEVERIAEASRAAGADEHRHVDARDAIFERFLVPLLRAGALRGDVYPLCVGVERTIQAEHLVAVARETGADAVVHGSTGSGNDQVRFDTAVRTLAPDLLLITPIRTLGLSRADETAWLRERGVPVEDSVKTYSINAGLWGVTIGGGETHDPWSDIPEEAWTRTADPRTAPDEPEDVVVSFEAGVPTAVDGRDLAGTELLGVLDERAGRHGVGRDIHLGDTMLGFKGRIAFEAPAAAVLFPAHRELEKLTLSRQQLDFKAGAARRYADLLHEAGWHEPLRADLEAYLEACQGTVTGDARVRLFKGGVRVTGVRSPHGLMRRDLALYGEENSLFDARDAEGFCRVRAVAPRLSQVARVAGDGDGGGGAS